MSLALASSLTTVTQIDVAINSTGVDVLRDVDLKARLEVDDRIVSVFDNFRNTVDATTTSAIQTLEAALQNPIKKRTVADAPRQSAHTS